MGLVGAAGEEQEAEHSGPNVGVNGARRWPCYSSRHVPRRPLNDGLGVTTGRQ